MNSLNEFTEIMALAREDLCGNVSGRFSPQDWELILIEARSRLNAKISSGDEVKEAWSSVIREFHKERFWGFLPNWQPSPTVTPRRNLGFSFVWMIFSTFVITLMAVVWLGQIYTSSDDPRDAYVFYASIVVALGNFVFFLWQSRHYED